MQGILLIFFNLWKQYRRKFIFSFLIYFLFVIIGFVIERYQPLLPVKNPRIAWYQYFYHNIEQSLIVIGLGVLSYGIISYALLAFNALIAGYAIEIMIRHHLTSAIWTAFLPHAVFEIPATILSVVVPFMVWRLIRNRSKSTKAKPIPILRTEIVPSLVLITLFLLVAGIMESLFVI